MRGEEEMTLFPVRGTLAIHSFLGNLGYQFQHPDLAEESCMENYIPTAFAEPAGLETSVRLSGFHESPAFGHCHSTGEKEVSEMVSYS